MESASEQSVCSWRSALQPSGSCFHDISISGDSKELPHLTSRSFSVVIIVGKELKYTRRGDLNRVLYKPLVILHVLLGLVNVNFTLRLIGTDQLLNTYKTNSVSWSYIFRHIGTCKIFGCNSTLLPHLACWDRWMFYFSLASSLLCPSSAAVTSQSLPALSFSHF